MLPAVKRSASDQELRPRQSAAELSSQQSIRRLRLKRPRPKQLQQTDSAGMYTSFSLTQDPLLASSMATNELVYPRILGDDSLHLSEQSLDAYWVSGFLDDVARNHHTKAKKALTRITSMPEALLYPRLAKELAVLKAQEPEPEFLSPRFDDYADHDNDGRRRKHQHPKSGLTKEDHLRLTNLERRLAVQRPPNKLDALKVYARTNKLIRLASQRRKPPPPAIHSYMLDAYFELRRKQQDAALVIQRFWKRIVIRRKLLKLYEKSKKVVHIQRLARGMITRKRVLLWYNRRNTLIIGWQAMVRRYISNIRTAQQLVHEWLMVMEIQRTIRGFLGRRRAQFVKRTIAATRIQALWRGVVSRIHSDLLYLSRKATIIQRIVRGFLARKDVRMIGMHRNGAARSIQQAWRGWISKKQAQALLFQRETEYREDWMAMLTAEEQWTRDEINRRKAALKKSDLERTVQNKRAELVAQYKEIAELEHDYRRLKHQIHRVTWVDLHLGWQKNLHGDVAHKRKEITNAKLDAIFKTTLATRKAEEELYARTEVIESVEAHLAAVQVWREQELHSFMKRRSDRTNRNSSKQQRQAVADERRKWKVQLYTPSGKPRKQPKSARKHPPAERMTYNPGNVDLFAFDKVSKNPHEGSTESVEHTTAQVALQTYLQQVEMYQQLLNPIAEILGRTGVPGLSAFTNFQSPGAEPGGSQLATARHTRRNRVPALSFATSADEASFSFGGAQGNSAGFHGNLETNRTDFTMDSDYIPLTQRDDLFNTASSWAYSSRGSAAPNRHDGREKRSNTAQSKKAASDADSVATQARWRASRTRESRVPWHLLDELDAEKKAFAMEKVTKQLDSHY